MEWILLLITVKIVSEPTSILVISYTQTDAIWGHRKLGSVGAVVLDIHGHLSAASTSGCLVTDSLAVTWSEHRILPATI